MIMKFEKRRKNYDVLYLIVTGTRRTHTPKLPGTVFIDSAKGGGIRLDKSTTASTCSMVDATKSENEK